MGEIEKALSGGANFKEAITAAEEILRASCEQIGPEVVHHFADGIYMREMRIKKGTVLTGKIHKTEHLCTLNGDISIASEDGTGRFTGYLTFLSKAGVKRIGYAHEDTVFTTVHAINGTDIKALEEALAVDTFEEYEQFLIARNAPELIQ